MKRTLTLILAFALCMALCACCITHEYQKGVCVQCGAVDPNYDAEAAAYDDLMKMISDYDIRSMFYTQFIREWKIIWNDISEILQPFTLKKLSFSFPTPKHRESNSIKDQKESEMLGCYRPTYQTVT